MGSNNKTKMEDHPILKSVQTYNKTTN